METALAGGPIAGSIIGAAGWYVLRKRISCLWIPAARDLVRDHEERQGAVSVFGGSGAIVFGLLTWFVLALLFRGRHSRPNAP